MSAIASSQPHNTDEELKATARLFQQAAGVFSKLKDTVLGMVQQEPTPDLMPDTLAALSALMVAQAQESVYTKASKGGYSCYGRRFYGLLFRSNEAAVAGQDCCAVC